MIASMPTSSSKGGKQAGRNINKTREEKTEKTQPSRTTFFRKHSPLSYKTELLSESVKELIRRDNLSEIPDRESWDVACSRSMAQSS